MIGPRIDESVDTVGISLRGDAEIGGQMSYRFVQDSRKAKHSVCLVLAQHGVSKDYGKLATHRPPQKVHLPQAIARRHVALRKIEVGVVCCFDVRNAAIVPSHSDAIPKSLKLKRLRTRASGCLW